MAADLPLVLTSSWIRSGRQVGGERLKRQNWGDHTPPVLRPAGESGPGEGSSVPGHRLSLQL